VENVDEKERRLRLQDKNVKRADAISLSDKWQTKKRTDSQLTMFNYIIQRVAAN